MILIQSSAYTLDENEVGEYYVTLNNNLVDLVMTLAVPKPLYSRADSLILVKKAQASCVVSPFHPHRLSAPLPRCPQLNSIQRRKSDCQNNCQQLKISGGIKFPGKEPPFCHQAPSGPSTTRAAANVFSAHDQQSLTNKLTINNLQALRAHSHITRNKISDCTI